MARPRQQLDIRTRPADHADHGNLVLYDNRTGTPRWASNTVGSGATQMLFQPDGNLVLYTAGYARAVWATGTNGACVEPYLALVENSNFGIYCGDWYNGQFEIGTPAVWATYTVF